MSGPSPSAGTQGFLFCDLRGYARFVDAHGDAAAAELLATYRGLVRSVIAGHAGAEIRTEGDSVYVVFGTASAAVEAGLAILAAARAASTPTRPIRVGVGVHAGETIATGEGPVGGAVNTAARVCAKAQAGELLVTDTVRSLTRTLLPVTFVGLGAQPLKGLGRVPLYRVEAISDGRLAHARRRLAARRRAVVGLALVAALALVGATAAWAVARPPDCLVLGPSTADVVARIDPLRGCVMALYPVGAGPSAVAVSTPPGGDPIVWVASDNWTVTLIDATTGAVRTSGVGGTPLSIAPTEAGDLVVLARSTPTEDGPQGPWRGATFESLALVTPSTGAVEMSHELPFDDQAKEAPTGTESGGYTAVAVDGDHVYFPDGPLGDLGVCRFDGASFCLEQGTTVVVAAPPDFLHLKPPTRGQEQPLGPGFVDVYHSGLDPIAVAGSTIWVGDTTAGTLYPVTGEVPGVPVPLEGSAGVLALAATPSALWALRGDGVLTSVDPVSGSQKATFPVGANVNTFAASGSSVWVGDPTAREVRALDPSNGDRLASVATGGRPTGIATAPDGSVWVAIVAGP